VKNPSDLTDRELDAAIAVEVMGWTVKTVHDPAMGETFDNYVNTNGTVVMNTDLWHPSYFISDAWQVVERMRELGWCFVLRDEPAYVCVFYNEEGNRYKWSHASGNAPRAICEAALAAVRNSKKENK